MTPLAAMSLVCTALSPRTAGTFSWQTDRLQIQMTQIQHHRLEEALVTLLPEGKEDP